jgi:hypothetical protein
VNGVQARRAAASFNFKLQEPAGTHVEQVLISTSTFLGFTPRRYIMYSTISRTIIAVTARRGPQPRPPRRKYHASVLPSRISTSSPEFQAKDRAMEDLIADLEAKTAHARLGGGAKAAERMKQKGKKLPRER